MHHFNLCNEALECRPTAENIALTVKSIMVEWDLENKVQAIVHDNAATMKAVARLLEDDIPDSINCSAHLLQLSIKDGLAVVPEFESICEKDRALTSHFHHSNIAKKALTDKQKQLGLPERRLIQSCNTRWNTKFYMCESLLKNRGAIEAVLSDRTVTKRAVAEKLEISEKGWSMMEQIVNLLKPFEVTTTLMCSESLCMLSTVRPVIRSIIFHHMAASTEDEKSIADFKSEICSSLSTRFDLDEEDITASLIASFFDPRYKNLSLESLNLRKCLHKCMKNQIRPTSIVEEESQIETALDYLFQVQIPKTDVAKEFEMYLRKPEIGHNCDPLTWWKNNSTKYPNILITALKYLGIPATSATSERTFSTTGNIVTSKRNCLLPENVHLLTFLYQNRSVMDKLL